MNLILFDQDETTRELSRTDPRAVHLLEVLRRKPGETFDAGLCNGPRGKGRIERIAADALILSFTWESSPPANEPVNLIIGLPRPQTARKILHEATAMGVNAIHFVAAEKGEANYAQSTLWSTGEWRRHVVSGAGQAFTTRLPEVSHGDALAPLLGRLPAASMKVALDNYEAPLALSRLEVPASIDTRTNPLSVTLALGPERGWSHAERELLRQNQFHLVHLGTRVLRTETACIAALTLMRAKLGLL